MESTAALAILASALLLLVGVGVALILRRRARRRRKPRVVEAPNSHYQSRGVQNLVDRERWEAMRMDQLHEINREEVVALLARIRENGVRTLSPSDRAFLDRMVAAVGTEGPKKQGGGGLGLPPRPVSPPPQPG